MKIEILKRAVERKTIVVQAEGEVKRSKEIE